MLVLVRRCKLTVYLLMLSVMYLSICVSHTIQWIWSWAVFTVDGKFNSVETVCCLFDSIADFSSSAD